VTVPADKGAAQRLSALLEEEFESLKAQDLDRFEAIQPEKVSLLGRLAQVKLPEANRNSGGQLPTDWQDFQDVVLECRDRHRRNSILIQRKLDAIRAALKALQGADPASSVEVYDRLGRIATGKKKSGYTDA
jgi:flagellar biosynthesis/type III secretory pathway chaperone